MAVQKTPPKVVFIGAGSMSFGLPTFRDVFTNPHMKGAELRLVDTDPENLERMYRLALRLNEYTGHGVTVLKTADRREALPGADFVVNSLAIERCELWQQDFEVPRKYGIRHCLGENGGPGALYFTMRTVPLLIDIAHDMEELCPDAWLFNFSNPETRIVLGVNLHTKIKCIGLCHGIYMARHDIAKMLGRDQEEIVISAAGMNHFQWVLSVRDAQTGEDLYPLLREKNAEYDESFRPYTRKMFTRFGLYPTCSDDHLGEYQAYGYEAGETGYNFAADAADRVRSKAEIAAIISGEKDPGYLLKPSGEHAIDIIVSVHFNIRRQFLAAIVLNGSAMPQLPPDIAVEIPVTADGAGIHKEVVDNLPAGVVGLLSMQVPAQRLSVHAAVNGSKELALQALLCDPVINSSEAAVKINDELFELNKKYIHKVI